MGTQHRAWQAAGLTAVKLFIKHRPQKGRQVKVQIIDYTGRGSSDPLYAAKLLIYTKSTRLTQGEDTRKKIEAMTQDEIDLELDYIVKTIRSSWEFVDFTFEITDVTRAFTHQFVRTRTASYAQQAQRVVDMSKFEARMPATVKANNSHAGLWKLCMDMIASTYHELHKAGIPAQDCRGVLPTNVYTNIIAKMNLRTLADLCGKRDNPRSQDEYTEVMQAMAAAMVETMPWVKAFLYPERTRTPAIDAILRELLGTASPVDRPKLNAAMKEIDALKSTWG
jgi:flavin-dependent thymidylate synthase